MGDKWRGSSRWHKNPKADSSSTVGSQERIPKIEKQTAF